MPDMDARVGRLEQQAAGQNMRMVHIEQQLTCVQAGVEKLLERDNARPPALTFKAVGATAVTIVSASAVVWFLIASSPAVTEISRRVDKLDDPTVGRVPRLEQHLQRYDWATVTRR